MGWLQHDSVTLWDMRMNKQRLLQYQWIETTQRDLRKYLNTDTPKARQFLERHFGKIVMEPAGKGYVASGNWDLLGGNQIRWDGAEGQS